MNGLHLIADLSGCRCEPVLLLDAARLEALCAGACARHELTVVGRLFHTFRDAAGAPAGVTGAVVLAESHLALHTWPEIAAVTLDIYVCNYSGDNSERARALFAEVTAAFAPGHRDLRAVERGRPGQPAG